MEQIIPYLPFIIPFAIIQFGLMIAALVHIFTHDKYKMGNRTLWVIISIVVSTIGPILYFIMGRSDKEEE